MVVQMIVTIFPVGSPFCPLGLLSDASLSGLSKALIKKRAD